MRQGRLGRLVETQRPHLALWAPVAFAVGIGGYFASPAEPQGWMLAALGAVLILMVATATRAGALARVVLIACALVGGGFEAAALRSRTVAAPVLAYPMTVNIEGRVAGLDRSASDRPRVLLDQVVIHGMEPEATPERVRISLEPAASNEALTPGLRILGQARLSPPAPPSEPGGFDFRQFAWFQGLGAVGYARTPMLETAGSDTSSFRQLAFRLRMAFSAHIQARVPGQNGAFAAAILTGDRSGIDRAVEDDLRVSNLYHIVSISGLHMSLLAAAVFALFRYGLALVPWIALHWPLKKIAAWAALIAGAAYLFISGSEVPTQRSYVMTATVLVAVLLDRPAITMRSVALAAFIVLMLKPESLTQAGFQMSFAATIALIATLDALRTRPWWSHVQTERSWRFVKPVIGVAMTSLVAGTATAPFSAFHFNVMSQYGLVANLLAVPAMGAVVMPAAVVAAILAPLGLDWLPFQIVGWGNGYILAVAAFIAGLGGAVTGVPEGPGASLVLISLGGIVLVLWIGRGRWVGLAPIALGAVLWAAHDRPDVLVADTGRLFGVRTELGRILSSGEGNGYAAESWLENDGDTASQAEAYARGALVRRRHRIETEVPGLGKILYVGATSPATASADCAGAAILIAPKWSAEPKGGCLFVGADRLRQDGALAITIDEGRASVEGSKSRNGGLPWTREPLRSR